MQNKLSYADRAIAVKAAAEYGHRDAQRQLGKMYLSGYKINRGTLKSYEIMLPCDTIKALYWLDKTALTGDVEAAKIAASHHLGGFGVEKDESKAFLCYSSCDAGLDYDIHYGLGICHYFGMGTVQNNDSALEQLIIAEDWHPEVPYLIAQIYISKSDSSAIKYLNKIIQRKNVNTGIMHESLRLLSECNRFGKCGLTVNIEEADRLAQESIKYPRITTNQIQDYFISLTCIDYENESL